MPSNPFRILIEPWFGSGIGILSLIAAVYFYIKSKHLARLAFQNDETTIVGGQSAAFPHQLEIRFAGDVVPRVTATRIVIWNAGNTIIRGSDIVASDPLRFQVPDDSRILQCHAIRFTREVNAVNIAVPSHHTAEISFDFLDPSDGAVFEIYHSSGRNTLKCEGTIRGVPAGVSNFGAAPWRLNRATRAAPFSLSPKKFAIAGLTVGSGFIAFGFVAKPVFKAYPILGANPFGDGGPWWVWALLGVVYMVPGILLIWRTRRRFPARLDITTDDPPINSRQA